MGVLVCTLSGSNILTDLSAAYTTLARAYLAHRAGSGSACGSPEPGVLDGLVCKTEDHVDLRHAREECSLITTNSERPGEIFDNLRHMFVLLEAIPLLFEKGLVPAICAPTQQSKDDNREDVPDLGAAGWALEAFGGVNIQTTPTSHATYAR